MKRVFYTLKLQLDFDVHHCGGLRINSHLPRDLQILNVCLLSPKHLELAQKHSPHGTTGCTWSTKGASANQHTTRAQLSPRPLFPTANCAAS